MQVTISDFLRLRQELPVIDVRSESEFEAGHVRSAANIPLLNNAERVIVGTAYKHQGQAEAINQGFKLVGQRLSDIVQESIRVAAGNETLVYCWRGGMRSNNFSQFIGMARVKSRTLEGGYKSYRHAVLESFTRPLKLISLTGCTGSGKSEILRALRSQGEQVLDLEHLANHKGSAFGGLMMPPQPSTEQFQNDLFEEAIRLDPSRRIWVEDESIAIGKIFLPRDFWHNMERSPLVKMEVSKDVRVQRLVNEYGPADRDEFLTIMGKITKKLGGQHYNAAKERLLHEDMTATIDILLTYYDKAYLNSIDKRKQRVSFSLLWDGKDATAYAKELISKTNDLLPS
ncbi:MAG TPA: tRNA 2-selenouridine(34) synthase MnmH [Cyclobacteriaceae bacterium]|nr:tRNA 2-selenouridine(34) synthase MnmH [Cyclobacteriaceae bacterium]